MTFIRVSRENTLFGLRAFKIESCPYTQLIICLDFWAKNVRIAYPVNYSYLPPCLLPHNSWCKLRGDFTTQLPVDWYFSVKLCKDVYHLCTTLEEWKYQTPLTNILVQGIAVEMCHLLLLLGWTELMLEHLVKGTYPESPLHKALVLLTRLPLDWHFSVVELLDIVYNRNWLQLQRTGQHC